MGDRRCASMSRQYNFARTELICSTCRLMSILIDSAMERLRTVAATALPSAFTLLVVDLLVGFEIVRPFERFPTDIARE